MPIANQHTADERRFGDFALGREIGRGGMGVVYEARQISLNRAVALKVLSSELGLTPRAVERFRREAEAAAKLHHTNIVPIYATGQQEGAYFYAMELIQGASLDHMLRQLRQQREQRASGSAPTPAPAPAPTPPAPAIDVTAAYERGLPGTADSECSSALLSSGSAYFDTVARLVAAIADALDHAHQQGVIHRDIKPSNLLMGADGRPSVTDFGLARMLERPGITMTGEFVGTPAYMSPEQITAGRVPLDHRTDVYSLGATLYELLTLTQPFRGVGRDQVLAQILQKDPVPPRKLDKKVPVDLETICLKALDKDPDRRYQSALAMAEDLRRHLKRFAILARRAGPLARAAKLVRRRPGAALLLAGLLLAAAVAGVLGYQGYVAEQQHQAAEQRHHAEQQQNAIDMARLAAVSGDFDQAVQALDQAERLDVPAAQLDLLRGEVAFHQGQMEQAIAFLKKAVALEPKSVAARALLACAYMESGEWVAHEAALGIARRLTPSTAEDYLFLGKAEAPYNPDQAVTLLEAAVQRRPSVSARLAHVDALVNVARDRGTVEQAQRAALEADVVKHLLPDNPVAMRYALEARTLGIYAYERAGDRQQRDLLVALARKDEEGLRQFPKYPLSLLIRWQFLRALGEQDALLTAMAKDPSPGVAEMYLTTLYRRGELDKARAALAEHSGVGFGFACLVLCEFPAGRAEVLKRYAQAAANPSTPAWPRVTNQIALLLLGHLEQARETSRALRQQGLVSPVKDAELQRTLAYLSGDLTSEAYFKAAGDSQVDQTNVHFLVGLTHLAQGERKAARQHFHQAVQTGGFFFDHYELSWALLGRMDQDPLWPRWLPVKD